MLVYVGAVGVVDAIHVGGVLDATATWRVEEAKDVGADGVPAESPGLAPPARNHVVAAFDDLVEVAHLVGDVVDTRAVRAMREQQRVLVGVAGAAHERPHVGQLIRDPEPEAVGVERHRAVPSLVGDVEGDVADADRVSAVVVGQRLVPATDGAEHVDLAARLLERHRVRHAETQREPGLVVGAQDALVDANLAIGADRSGERVEIGGVVHAPDDLPHIGAGRDRGRQRRIVGAAQVQVLVGRGAIGRAGGTVLHALEAEVVEETHALVDVLDAEAHLFNSYDRHDPRP